MAIEALLYVILVILLLVLWKLFNAKKENKTLAILEEKHRQMLLDINDSLNKQSDRFNKTCLLYTSPSPRDSGRSRMPSSA